MYTSPSQYPPYASPDQQPYHQGAARPPYTHSGEYDVVCSHQSQARSSSLHALPSRVTSTSTRRSSESSLSHALDEHSLERRHPSPPVISQYSPFQHEHSYRYPSPSGSSHLSCSSPSSPPASFYDYGIQSATRYHLEQEQPICDQEMSTIPEYASLSISDTISPLPHSAADVDEDEGMCMDGASMSCAEYEGSQFYGISDGGGGSPCGQDSRTIDVSGGQARNGREMITGNHYKHLEDATVADPSFVPVYSPTSSYDYDYDYDVPSYDGGDIVDSPVDGDGRFWSDSLGTMNYQNGTPRHYSMDVPTRSYTLEAAITPPPELPIPTVIPKKEKKPDVIPSSQSQPHSQAPTRAPRGRPRKNPHRQPESASKYRTSSSASPTTTPPSVPLTNNHSSPSVPAPTLSMDEIPVPDAESKPGQAVFKLTPSTIPGVTSGIPGAGGASGKEGKKKPIMACLFCRERKIACGPPAPGSANTRCNQCVRRGLECEYPKESRRGQHKRGPRAVRVQALTEEREQKASGSSSPSGNEQGTTSPKSPSSGVASSNSPSLAGSNREASIKAGTKRKEKALTNGRSSSKMKGKSPVKVEETEISVDAGGRRD